MESTTDDGPEPDETIPASYPPEPDEPAVPTPMDGGTTHLLRRLLTITPFIDLDNKAGGDHGFRRGVCFTTDFLLRLVVYLMLLGIIAGVAWKTLAPLPGFSTDR